VSITVLRCVAVVLFTLTACRTIAPPLRSGGLVTVCDLAKNPAKFTGEIVTVEALVASDAFHSTSLRDNACVGAGITLKLNPQLEEQADVITMRQAIITGVPGTQGKTISGSFTGRFEWRRRGRPSYVLVAESTKYIRIQQAAE